MKHLQFLLVSFIVFLKMGNVYSSENSLYDYTIVDNSPLELNDFLISINYINLNGSLNNQFAYIPSLHLFLRNDTSFVHNLSIEWGVFDVAMASDHSKAKHGRSPLLRIGYDGSSILLAKRKTVLKPLRVGYSGKVYLEYEKVVLNGIHYGLEVFQDRVNSWFSSNFEAPVGFGTQRMLLAKVGFSRRALNHLEVDFKRFLSKEKKLMFVQKFDLLIGISPDFQGFPIKDNIDIKGGFNPIGFQVSLNGVGLNKGFANTASLNFGMRPTYGKVYQGFFFELVYGTPLLKFRN